MAWFSMLPWTTDTTGDGAARYNEERANEFFRIFDVRDEENEGVVPGRWDEFAVSGTATPLTVAAGAAVCYGRVWNDAASTLAVTTPTTGTTGGRVVLRADWTAKTIRAVVKMSGDGNGAIPALTQTAGATWEISLATFQVTTGGVITVTDDRKFQKPLLEARQGGDPDDWGDPGSTTYAVTSMLTQAGAVTFPVNGSGVPVTSIFEDVTFPIAFGAEPLMLATLSGGVNGYLYAAANGATTGRIAMIFNPAVDTDTFATVSWVAMGPRP